MEIIKQINENQYLLIGIIVLTTLLICWFVLKIIQLFFYNEVTLLIQNIFFKTFFLFKITTSTFITIVIISLMYFMNISAWFSVIPLFFYFYMIYRIFLLKNNEDSILRTEFYFQKFSTSLKYIKLKDITYRQKAYNSLINKIALINLEHKNYESKGFLLAFSKIFTFDNFNSKIENFDSKKTSGQLFYRKYKLSLFEMIDDVRKINNEDFVLEKVLSDFRMLDFDGEKGLHYNSNKALDLVNGLTKENNTDLYNKFRKALLIKTDIKTAIKFFNKYVELEFSNNTNLKHRFKKMVEFCKGDLDALPQFDDSKAIKVADLKRIIAMLSQFNDRKDNMYKVFSYQVPEMIDLLLYFSSKMEEKENTSLPKAHSEKAWELNKDTRTALNSILDKTVKNNEN